MKVKRIVADIAASDLSIGADDIDIALDRVRKAGVTVESPVDET